MTDQAHSEAVELLQELGLKEYEARCFVALSRLPQATAKEISEISEVPRTRVYDATRVLESKGLVETYHGSPKQFRAIPIDDAVELLRAEYRSRTDSLRDALESMDSVDPDDEADSTQAIWALSNAQAITNRAQHLVEDADSEVVLVVGHEDAVTESLREPLRAAHRRGLSIVVGATTEELRDSLDESLLGIEIISLCGTWLGRAAVGDGETEIGRVLLVDRETVLISTFRPVEDDEHREEAVVCHGQRGGLVPFVHRALLRTFSAASTTTAPGLLETP